MSGFLGAGDVYFDRLDEAGLSTGIVFLFDAKQFAITHPSEDVDRILRGRDNYGQLGDSVKIQQPATIEITGDEISPAVLAVALLGEVSTPSQVMGTVTEAVFTPKHDVWVPLPHQYINAAGFVLTNTAGTTTYVENTDYNVNRRLGWVMALSTGAIANNVAGEVSYGYAAATGKLIAGGSRPTVRGRLILDGKNLATQRDAVCDVDLATLAPTEAVDFASVEYVSVTLAGKLVTLPGKTSPYAVQLR